MSRAMMRAAARPRRRSAADTAGWRPRRQSPIPWRRFRGRPVLFSGVAARPRRDNITTSSTSPGSRGRRTDSTRDGDSSRENHGEEKDLHGRRQGHDIHHDHACVPISRVIADWGRIAARVRARASRGGPPVRAPPRVPPPWALRGPNGSPFGETRGPRGSLRRIRSPTTACGGPRGPRAANVPAPPPVLRPAAGPVSFGREWQERPRGPRPGAPGVARRGRQCRDAVRRPQQAPHAARATALPTQPHPSPQRPSGTRRGGSRAAAHLPPTTTSSSSNGATPAPPPTGPRAAAPPPPVTSRVTPSRS